MTYTGEIRHGVIVLKNAPKLKEGTQVKVEVEPNDGAPPRGSSAAILQAVARSGGWADSTAEMDEALEYIRKSKWDDVRRQLAEPEPEL